MNVLQSSSPLVCPQSIGIVGAGIGGSATANFLRDALAAAGRQGEVHVYEKSDRACGRVTTTQLPGGLSPEAGAAVIHRKNLHMVRFAKALGLERGPPGYNDGPRALGIFDGDRLAFEGSRWGWLTGLRMLWRYGYSLLRMEQFTAETLERFMVIYDRQARNETFATPDAMLATMGLLDLTQISLLTKMGGGSGRSGSDGDGASDGVSSGDGASNGGGSGDDSSGIGLPTHPGLGLDSALLRELVAGVTRVNYGQGPASINALAGAVGLAGSSADLWVVRGGNHRVGLAAFLGLRLA